MALTFADLSRQTPALLATPAIVGLSTDSSPVVGEDGGELMVGQTWLHEDTGALKYYTGSEWKLVDANQERGLQTALLFKILDRLTGEDE